MAPLPTNNTGRVWVDYITGGGLTSQEHTVMIRYSPALGGSFAEALTELCTALITPGVGAYFDGWQIIGARHAAPGSDISFPITVPTVFTSFVGAGQATATRPEQAREARFVGRSSAEGRRNSFSVYGVISSSFSQADFREPALEGNYPDDVLSVISEAETGNWVAIDGSFTVWYPYMNWQYNSYWERKLRT